jgi:hypothetical protein
MSHGETIRGFAGYSPIEINAIAFAHRMKIRDWLGKIQRWRLGNARNPAADKRGGATQQ